MIKEKLIQLIYELLNASKINNLYLGVLIKAIHFQLPSICLISIAFLPKIFAIGALFLCNSC